MSSSSSRPLTKRNPVNATEEEEAQPRLSPAKKDSKNGRFGCRRREWIFVVLLFFISMRRIDPGIPTTTTTTTTESSASSSTTDAKKKEEEEVGLSADATTTTTASAPIDSAKDTPAAAASAPATATASAKSSGDGDRDLGVKEEESTQTTTTTTEEKNDDDDDDDEGKLPSAKALLTSKPPFDDSDVILLRPSDSDAAEPLIESPNTIVTGYFRIPSKHSSTKYDDWMRNMLSLKDAMVIFTEPDMVDQVSDLRRHAVDRTVIVPLKLDDLPIGRLFSEDFWRNQLDRDPEKRIHKSYQVFWIWLSKSWCVQQAIRMNFYKSDVFVWSDIGCFRSKTFNNRTLVSHRENVPRHEILQMAHRRPDPPGGGETLFADKYKRKSNFYHSGSQFVGYMDTMLTFHELFLETIDRFLEKDMLIVEDQHVLQSTCLSHPEICAYAPSDQVRDNNYFGLRTVLNRGGNYTYWRYLPSQ